MHKTNCSIWATEVLGKSTTPFQVCVRKATDDSMCDADLEEDDLDLVYLKVAGGRVVRFAGAVDVVLRVAEVAAVWDGAASTSGRRQRRRRRQRRQRLATVRGAGTCRSGSGSGGLMTARAGSTARHSSTDVRHVRLDMILSHVNLHVQHAACAREQVIK